MPRKLEHSVNIKATVNEIFQIQRAQMTHVQALIHTQIPASKQFKQEKTNMSTDSFYRLRIYNKG